MTTSNSKLHLQLLADKRLLRRSGEGFTLIELMVTVATLGVLAAVAFPAFSGAQNRAAAGATVGSMQAFAKECSTNAITGNATAIDGGNEVDLTNGGDCSAGSVDVTNANTFTAGDIGGLVCGNDALGAAQTANGTNHDTCTLSVGTDGAITGAWS